MRARIGKGLILVLLTVSLSGCPPRAVSTGVWVFTVDGDVLVGLTFGSGRQAETSFEQVALVRAGLTLGNGGQTETPNPLPIGAEASFDGTPTWVQNGTTFTLTQVSGAITVEYSGTVDTRTSIINGTWMQTAGGSASGTWFAEKS